jgi:hypothetical protein
MNFLETFWNRKDQVTAILKAQNVPYKDDKEALSQTASSWANSNLTIEQIEFLLKNADTKITEDINSIKDLHIAMEGEQLRKGVITK